MQANNRRGRIYHGLRVCFFFLFPLGIPFRLVGLFPLSYRFNEKYLVTGCCGQVKIWDLEALIDFQNDDSHPFLLTTLPVTVFDRINYILLNS